MSPVLHDRGRDLARESWLKVDIESALDAILALRDLWARKNGRLTLADLGIRVTRRIRSRGNAALPPERWRGHRWERTTSHEVVFEA